jgi:hypothetical protein
LIALPIIQQLPGEQRVGVHAGQVADVEAGHRGRGALGVVEAAAGDVAYEITESHRGG